MLNEEQDLLMQMKICQYPYSDLQWNTLHFRNHHYLHVVSVYVTVTVTVNDRYTYSF